MHACMIVHAWQFVSAVMLLLFMPCSFCPPAPRNAQGLVLQGARRGNLSVDPLLQCA